MGRQLLESRKMGIEEVIIRVLFIIKDLKNKSHSQNRFQFVSFGFVLLFSVHLLITHFSIAICLYILSSFFLLPPTNYHSVSSVSPLYKYLKFTRHILCFHNEKTTQRNCNNLSHINIAGSHRIMLSSYYYFKLGAIRKFR